MAVVVNEDVVEKKEEKTEEQKEGGKDEDDKGVEGKDAKVKAEGGAKEAGTSADAGRPVLNLNECVNRLFMMRLNPLSLRLPGPNPEAGRSNAHIIHVSARPRFHSSTKTGHFFVRLYSFIY
jgi:hypothetical protein